MEDKLQIIKGTIIGVTPVWATWLAVVHDILSFIAVTTGAIIGIAGVYGLYKKWKASRMRRDKDLD